MDLAIQKLTEIGINKIIPLAVKRGVAKITEKKISGIYSKRSFKTMPGS